MPDDALQDQAHLSQFRLFLEEICSELCRFHHVVEDGLDPQAVRISREVPLDAAGSYADIRVQAPGQPPYFVEVKFDYPTDKLIADISRKYGVDSGLAAGVNRLVLLIRSSDYPNWTEVESDLRAVLHPDLELEIWDEHYLNNLMRDRFGVEIAGATDKDVLAVRQAIDQAKWRYAFGDEFAEHPLAPSLLWHFGFWTLRRFHEEQRLRPQDVLRPGLYQQVAIVMADLCSFSGYVRDTRDDEVIRRCLTTFYSQARHAIHDSGGMMYQFVGDEVVAMFGLHEATPNYMRDALDCAEQLIDVGNSVCNLWQRELDRVQKSSGVHIGIGVGDLNLVLLRPFSGDQVGFIGDSLNIAARLMGHAGPSEIVVSNGFYRGLDSEVSQNFQEQQPVEGKNVGLIRCWKLPSGLSGSATSGNQ